MCGPRKIAIHEVSPRDGFQIEPQWIATEQKVHFIDVISRTGVAKIEVSSFASPKAVPQLRDAAEVFARIKRLKNVTYVALVPNRRGFEKALQAEVDEVNLVMSASETHNRANMGMSCTSSLAGFAEICRSSSKSGPGLNGTVATAFGCPFEGPQARERVLGIIGDYLDRGIQSITLADTPGMANPRQVTDLVETVLARYPAVPLAMHFHNTRGMGLANALAAYDAGATMFDASLGGIGGCPFAPGATGNVCTEDLVHMFSCMGVGAEVDLDALIDLAATVPALVGHEVPGQVVKAGKSSKLFPSSALCRANTTLPVKGAA
jgi:hydroxymethylglutaryl-CoA lyase